MSSESLLELASSRQGADRERLLLAIADLCNTPGAAPISRSPPVQTLLNAIFLPLVVDAAHDTRRRLAEKLATADWPSSALVNVLAWDDIEIARPIIATSPVLDEGDLVRLLVEGTLKHQIEIARRPQLASVVVAAILDTAEPAVLAAFAADRSATLFGAPPEAVHGAEQEEMEQRLVAKLHAAGQLRPGYLIRALRERRLGVFAAALATLGALDPVQVRRCLNSDQPELLALACAAVDIDRSVFPDILEMVRGLNAGLPGGGAESARRAYQAFAPVSPEVARSAFCQAASVLCAV